MTERDKDSVDDLLKDLGLTTEETIHQEYGSGVTVAPLHLISSEFWDASPELSAIRTIAESRETTPDAPYSIALNRFWTLRDPRTRVGIDGGEVVPNRYTLIGAPTGSGKDYAVSTADKLLKPDWGGEVTVIPVSTGQGLYNAYWAKHEQGGREEFTQEFLRGYGEITEGANLVAYLKDPKFKLGGTLCAMWMGSAVGGGGVRGEARIGLDEGGYVFDLTTMIQPENALDLVELTKTTGLGGRMVYADPRIPQEWVEREDWPDAVDSPFPEALKWMRKSGPKTWEVPRSAARDLKRLSRRNRTGLGAVDPLDAQEGLVKSHEYGALMQLHCGAVKRDDAWELVGLAWDASRDTREQVLASGREERSSTLAQSNRERAAESVARHLAVEEVKTGANPLVVAAAKSMYAKVKAAHPGVASKTVVETAWKGRRSKQYRDSGGSGSFPLLVQRYAETVKWVRKVEQGWVPGPSTPSK